MMVMNDLSRRYVRLLLLIFSNSKMFCTSIYSENTLYKSINLSEEPAF